MSKILVEGAAHKANTSDGCAFRVNQRPLSIAQRGFFNGIIEDKMLGKLVSFELWL